MNFNIKKMGNNIIKCINSEVQVLVKLGIMNKL